MDANTPQRNFSRNYTELPIMFADYHSRSFSDAKMFNKSVDGMYFELDYALQPGFNISIKKVNDTPDMDYDPEAYKTCRAKVIWCKKIDDMNTSRYGVGVQFFKLSMQ